VSEQFSKEQMEELAKSVAVLRPRPVGCTCGKESEPLPYLHSIGCGFRAEAGRQMRAADNT
jgi:hypothetical protein